MRAAVCAGGLDVSLEQDDAADSARADALDERGRGRYTLEACHQVPARPGLGGRSVHARALAFPHPRDDERLRHREAGHPAHVFEPLARAFFKGFRVFDLALVRAHRADFRVEGL